MDPTAWGRKPTYKYIETLEISRLVTVTLLFREKSLLVTIGQLSIHSTSEVFSLGVLYKMFYTTTTTTTINTTTMAGNVGASFW